MKKVILVSMLVCCFGLPKAEATITYSFGGEWDIDFPLRQSLDIIDSSVEGPTTVNLLDGGLVYTVSVYINSVFNMLGGRVGYSDLRTYHNSTAYICGGVIDGNLDICDRSQLTIEGTGFNYPYGTYNYTAGYLTGTLLNGDPIATPFQVRDSATITLVPEPATLLLLGLGAVILRKRCQRSGRRNFPATFGSFARAATSV